MKRAAAAAAALFLLTSCGSPSAVEKGEQVPESVSADTVSSETYPAETTEESVTRPPEETAETETEISPEEETEFSDTEEEETDTEEEETEEETVEETEEVTEAQTEPVPPEEFAEWEVPAAFEANIKLLKEYYGEHFSEGSEVYTGGFETTVDKLISAGIYNIGKSGECLLIVDYIDYRYPNYKEEENPPGNRHQLIYAAEGENIILIGEENYEFPGKNRMGILIKEYSGNSQLYMVEMISHNGDSEIRFKTYDGFNLYSELEGRKTDGGAYCILGGVRYAEEEYDAVLGAFMGEFSDPLPVRRDGELLIFTPAPDATEEGLAFP